MKKIDTRKRIAVDLDGTLTTKAHFADIWDMTPRQLNDEYNKIKPDRKMISIINELYDKGYIIYIFTARSNLYQRQTKKWLEKYKVKYHYFIMDKPYYSLIVDDKCLSPNSLKRYGIKAINKILKEQK